MSPAATIYDDDAVEQFRSSRAIDPKWLRRFRYKYLRMQAPLEAALDKFPKTDREAFVAEFSLELLTLVDRSDSQVDGATKLVFETRAGRRLETVILRAPKGRTTVCVSSQVGCAARCSFCATGYLPEAHNLTPVEIVDQVVQADRMVGVEGRRVRNVVFMGMGEPLHNEANAAAAVERLNREDWLGIPLRRTVISTVGVPDGMIRWAQRFRRSGVALSLHSVDATLRQQLIPLARKYSLEQLRATMEEVNAIQRQPMLVEYLMLHGVNDSLEDADALAEYLGDLDVHVNLIPFNPILEAPQFEPSPKPVRENFGWRLRELGYTVTIRYSQGSDIQAACGQLAKRS